MNTIGEDSKFYGYITGLFVERDTNERNFMVARFEYNDSIDSWIVPSVELFTLLSSRLIDMASERDGQDGFGYQKLWIEKKDGKWIADLP